MEFELEKLFSSYIKENQLDLLDMRMLLAHLISL